MKVASRIVVIALLVAGSLGTSAQDIHFSQFYLSPLTLNPANTGAYNGDWRVMNNFRRQWSAVGPNPYSTASLAYDQNFYIRNHNLSGGIIVIGDRSGDARLTMNKFFLSTAYHYKLRNHTFHGGIQGGYVRKTFSIDALTFPDQWDVSQGYFNNSMSNNETGLTEQLNYLDLNIGGKWEAKFRKMECEFGMSVFHFNNPKESFFGNNERLNPRGITHGSVKYDLNDKFFVWPNFIFMGTTKASDMLLGTNVAYRLNNKIKYAYAGAQWRDGWKRNTDAIVAMTGVELNNWHVGVSYDINVSDLTAATNGRGGIEIAVIYTALSTVPKKIKIPCDRY